LPLGGEDPHGRYDLRFAGECAESGRPFELVALPGGAAFDLVGVAKSEAPDWMGATIEAAGSRRPPASPLTPNQLIPFAGASYARRAKRGGSSSSGPPKPSQPGIGLRTAAPN
jgi:hypothetical protein